jgi:phage gpG-like protein
MTPKEFQSHIKGLKKDFKAFINTSGPKIAGNKAVSMFKENFREEGFFGEKWKDVKRRGTKEVRVKLKSGKTKIKTVPAAKGAARKRRILTGETGDLGRSIRIKSSGHGKVEVWSDPEKLDSTPYGAVHNEGLRSGRGKGFTMPRRRFMGDHPDLRQGIAGELSKELKKITEKK